MNCTNCGTNLPDGSMFCPVCGTKVQQQPVVEAAPASAPTPVATQPVYQQPMNAQPTYQQAPVNAQPTYQQPMNAQPTYQQPMNAQPAYQQPMNAQPAYQQPAPKKSKAPWIALGVVVALLIATIITVVICFVACKDDGCESPSAAVTTFLNSLASNDTETLASTIYPCYLSFMKLSGEVKSDAEFYANIREDAIDDVKIISFSNIKIEDQEMSDTTQIPRMNAMFSSMDGYIEITSMLEVEGTVDAIADGEKCSYEFDFDIVNCDGSYYIIDFSMYQDY